MFAAASAIATSSPSKAPHISKCLSQSPAGQTSMTGRNDIICRQAQAGILLSTTIPFRCC